MLIRSCLQKLLLSLDDVNLGYVFGRIRERFVGGKCKIWEMLKKIPGAHKKVL